MEKASTNLSKVPVRARVFPIASRVPPRRDCYVFHAGLISIEHYRAGETITSPRRSSPLPRTGLSDQAALQSSYSPRPCYNRDDPGEKFFSLLLLLLPLPSVPSITRRGRNIFEAVKEEGGEKRSSRRMGFTIETYSWTGVYAYTCTVRCSAKVEAGEKDHKTRMFISRRAVHRVTWGGAPTARMLRSRKCMYTRRLRVPAYTPRRSI